MSRTLWDILVAAGQAEVTKKKFGKIMHDENETEEYKQSILKEVAELGGYENLPDDPEDDYAYRED